MNKSNKRVQKDWKMGKVEKKLWEVWAHFRFFSVTVQRFAGAKNISAPEANPGHAELCQPHAWSKGDVCSWQRWIDTKLGRYATGLHHPDNRKIEKQKTSDDKQSNFAFLYLCVVTFTPVL